MSFPKKNCKSELYGNVRPKLFENLFLIRKSFLGVIFSGLICFLLSGCFLGYLFTPQLEKPYVSVDRVDSDSALIFFSTAENTDEYRIIYSCAHDEFEFVEMTSSNLIELRNLYWNEEYNVKVQAVSLSSNYKDSDYVYTSFKTKDRVIPEGDLKSPENFKVQLSSDKSSVILTWASVENAAFYDIDCSYLVYKDSDALPQKSGGRIITVPASQTSVIDDKIKKGQTIEYLISARNEDFSNSCWWSKPERVKK